MVDGEHLRGGCFHLMLQIWRRESVVAARPSVNDLEQSCSAHAAADTHGHHAISGLASAPLDQKMSGEARPGHAIGVADRDRAAIDVELLGIDAQFVTAIDHLDCIGLVQFPEIDVVDLKPMTAKQARYCGDRS